MFVIDRIEGDLVVCENLKTGEIKNFSLKAFPNNIFEGELFEIENEEIVVLSHCEMCTCKKRIRDKMNSLWI